MTDLVLVPAPLALLPEYAGRRDPIAEVRRAAEAAVAWLVERSTGVLVVTGADRTGRPEDRPSTPAGLRVARSLLTGAGSALPVTEVVADDGVAPAPPAQGCGVLVVADGSARRSLKAPGHLDERSFALDEAVGAALASGDPATFGALDDALAGEVLCGAVPVLRAVGSVLTGRRAAEVRPDLDADPYGVQYWVVRWGGIG